MRILQCLWFGTLLLDSPYYTDIQRLGMVKNQQQLEQNDIITTFKVRQFIIRLYRDSFISFKRYMNEKKIQVLSDVVEDHLFIDQFDGLPRTQQIDAVCWVFPNIFCYYTRKKYILQVIGCTNIPGWSKSKLNFTKDWKNKGIW